MSTISASTTTTTAYKVTADTTGTLVLQTGATPTTAMTIDGSQNVGVGVTPSTSLYPTVQVAQSSWACHNYGTGNLQMILSNNSTDAGNYIATNYASSYTQVAGQHIWKSAPSGTAGNPITFTTAMTLDASGRLLVGGTTAVGGIATFYGSQQSFIIKNGINSSYNEFGVWDGASDGLKAVIKAEGGVAKFGSRTNSNVGIQVNDTVIATFSGSLGTGLVYTNGGVFTSTNPSDERLKSNIENLSWGLNSILALRPVSYTWNNDVANQGKQYGFIAQEVKTVMPELVREFQIKENEEVVTRLGLEKEGIYAAMVKAIQEQQAIIQAQAADIAALKAKVGI